MIELTVVLKSKDMSSNNYTFVTLMQGNESEAVERSIFSRPKDAFLPLRSDNADAVFVSMSDISFISIKQIDDNLVMGQTPPANPPADVPDAPTVGAPAAPPAPKEESQQFDVSDIASK